MIQNQTKVEKMNKFLAYGTSIEDFTLEENIGRGGFAEVFKARSKNLDNIVANKFVAIKRIDKKHCDFKRYKNEVEIHSSLSPKPEIVRYYTDFEDENYWYIVLELCSGGSLHEYMQNKKQGLPEEEAIKLIRQVINGVKVLHHHRIIHRDLSLKNLLLTDSYSHVVKIADFGLAIKLNDHDKANTMLGTVNFMSPEVCNNDLYDFKSDCWSVGCVLYTLLCGSTPFPGKKREFIMEKVKHTNLNFPHYVSREAKEVLKALLNKDPKQRIEIKDALKYSVFEKYYTSQKENKTYHHKSGSDSGMSSISSSGSKTPSADCEPIHLRAKKERKNRSVKSVSTTRSRDYLCDNMRSRIPAISHLQRPEHPQYQESQNSPSFTSPMKNKFCTLPSRYESQYDTPVKKHPECPPYPVDAQYLAKINLNSQLYCSDYDSVSYKNQSVKCSSSLKYCSTNRQNSPIKNYVENTMNDPSCSHDKYCVPANNCLHKPSCCCQQIRSNPYPSLRNCANENKNCMDVRNTDEKCLKDLVSPVNTARLSYRRKELEKKDVIFTILSDGQVCLEHFKLRKGKKYLHLVYYISDDGLQIIVYKPKNKIPVNPDQPPPVPHNEHEVQCFNFENLPTTYWKNYQLVKRFVDSVRGFTVKVKIYGEKAACIMMENSPNPNYEMNFYNGFQITEVRQKKTFRDKNGSIITKTDVINSMLEEFEKMKEKCIMLEKNIEAFQNSNFPVILGKKPDTNKRSVMLDYKKEDIPANSLQSPSLHGLNSGVKHCEITIGSENSIFKNTFQGNTSTPYSSEKSTSSSKSKSSENSIFKDTFQGNASTPYSSEKSTSSSKSKSSILPHLKNLEVVNDWVIADYEDGIQMCISMHNDERVFKDAKTQELLSTRLNPHLMDRYEKDSRTILRHALLKEVERKM